MSGKISYRLNSEFVEILEEAFPIQTMIQEYQKEKTAHPESKGDDIERKIFGGYGSKAAWMTCDKEKNYRDRNAEVIYMIAEKTGHWFPSVQQRLIEIAYIALMYENKMRFREVSFKRLAYEVSHCMMYKALKETLGPDAAGALPCRFFCLELFGGICEQTGMKGLISIEMIDRMADHAHGEGDDADHHHYGGGHHIGEDNDAFHHHDPGRPEDGVSSAGSEPHAAGTRHHHDSGNPSPDRGFHHHGCVFAAELTPAEQLRLTGQ